MSRLKQSLRKAKENKKPRKSMKKENFLKCKAAVDNLLENETNSVETVDVSKLYILEGLWHNKTYHSFKKYIRSKAFISSKRIASEEEKLCLAEDKKRCNLYVFSFQKVSDIVVAESEGNKSESEIRQEDD